MTRAINRLGWAAAVALSLLVIAALAGLVSAGPLDPTAPPGSTQEAQINSCPFPINTSGSYVFTHELTCPAASDGITVSAANVTIDMRGFALVGPGGAVAHGSVLQE